MTNISFARGAALFLAPMVLASCGGSSETPPEEPPISPLIINSPDKALAGCTDLGCNPDVRSGVGAVITTGPQTSSAVIAFGTLTDNGNGTFTLNTGTESIVFDDDVVGLGPGGEVLITFPLGTYVDGGYVILPPDTLSDGVLGYHTDASEVPMDGTADYFGLGGGYVAYGVNAIETVYEGYGDAALSVDFGSKTADLDIDINDLDCGELCNPLTQFDHIDANGMLIDGYSFTGGDVVVMDGVTDRTSELMGTYESGSAGMFYGPLNVDGNPEEFGAVAVIDGTAGYIYGVGAGEAVLEPVVLADE